MLTGSLLAKLGIDLAYLGLKGFQIRQAIVESAAEMRRKFVFRIKLRAALLKVGQGHVQRLQREGGFMYVSWRMCDPFKEFEHNLAGLGSKADHSDN